MAFSAGAIPAFYEINGTISASELKTRSQELI